MVDKNTVGRAHGLNFAANINLFLTILYHSKDEIKKHKHINNVNKKDPLIMKNKVNGTNIDELTNLFENSLFIKLIQSFSLNAKIFL